MKLVRLHAIVDVGVAERAGWTPVELAAAFLKGGARLLQLRAKTLGSGAFLETARRIGALARQAGAVLVVNDRADIARISNAGGVHVGQDDLTPVAARAIAGPGVLVGLSTHTEAQIEAAGTEPISYMAVGPVFGTGTKDTGYAAVGLERVRYAARMVRLKADPTYVESGFSRTIDGASGFSRTVDVESGFCRTCGVVAIGGITLDRAAAVIEAGATSVAVITDLLATGDPEARVRAYLARLAE